MGWDDECVTTSATPPTVSVVLCTHNGAAFIGEQVASILAQTRLPDEIVLGDDASTDGTVDLVEAALADSGIPLVVLRNDPPLRVTKNFERTALAATGELLVFSDQDDAWHPERVSRAVDAFAADPELLLVHSDARLVDAEGHPLGRTLFESMGVTPWELERIRAGRGIEALVRRSLVTGATMTVRRELVERAAPFPSNWVHDEWLAVIAGLTGRFLVLTEPLIDYRQHGGNQIGASRLTARTAVRKLLEPRGPRNARLLANTEALVARLPELPGVAQADAELVRGKLAHEAFRYALPAARVRRIRPVCAARRRGDYDRFSQGRRDVLRDLVQPAS